MADSDATDTEVHTPTALLVDTTEDVSTGEQANNPETEAEYEEFGVEFKGWESDDDETSRMKDDDDEQMDTTMTAEEVKKMKKELKDAKKKIKHLQAALHQLSLDPKTRDERFRDCGYVNWIVCTMAMVKAKDAIGPTTKKVMKQEVDVLFKDKKIDCSHEHTGSSDKTNDEVQKGCKKCEPLRKHMTTLVKKHPMGTQKKKTAMNMHHCQYKALGANPWNLAKIFIPEFQSSADGPDQIDPAAMFKLLDGCTLFDVEHGLVERLLKWRNTLMHSPDNKFATSCADICLQNLCKLLKHSKQWKEEDSCKEMVDYLEKLLKPDTDIVEDTADLDMTEQAALEEKSNYVKAEKKEAENKGEDTTMYNALLAVTNTIKKNNKIETLNKDIKEKDEEIKEVTTVKKDLEKKVDVLEQENITLEEKKGELEEKYSDVVEQYKTQEKEIIEQHQRELDEKEQELRKITKEKESLSLRVPEPEAAEIPADHTAEDIVARQILVQNLSERTTDDFVKLFFESKRHITPQVRVDETERIAWSVSKVTLEEPRYVDIILDKHEAFPLVIAGSPVKITALRDTGGAIPEDALTPSRFAGYDAPEGDLGDENLGRKIVKVDSLENTNVFSKYHRHKQRLSGVKQAERTMWYCVTQQQDIDDIKTNGFSINYPGRHKSDCGVGVYFVERLPELYKYWTQVKSDETTWVIQAKVLTGRCCQGHEKMTSPPADYDSAVNSMETPTEFVIFNMELAYPEFLVTFRCSG